MAMLVAFLLDMTNAPNWQFHDSGVFENRNETPFIPSTYAHAVARKDLSLFPSHLSHFYDIFFDTCDDYINRQKKQYSLLTVTF